MISGEADRFENTPFLRRNFKNIFCTFLLVSAQRDCKMNIRCYYIGLMFHSHVFAPIYCSEDKRNTILKPVGWSKFEFVSYKKSDVILNWYKQSHTTMIRLFIEKQTYKSNFSMVQWLAVLPDINIFCFHTYRFGKLFISDFGQKLRWSLSTLRLS